MTLKDMSGSIAEFFRRKSTISHSEMMMFAHVCSCL